VKGVVQKGIKKRWQKMFSLALFDLESWKNKVGCQPKGKKNSRS